MINHINLVRREIEDVASPPRSCPFFAAPRPLALATRITDHGTITRFRDPRPRSPERGLNVRDCRIADGYDSIPSSPVSGVPQPFSGDLCGATIRMGSRIASGRNVPERLFVASS